MGHADLTVIMASRLESSYNPSQQGPPFLLSRSGRGLCIHCWADLRDPISQKLRFNRMEKLTDLQSKGRAHTPTVPSCKSAIFSTKKMREMRSNTRTPGIRGRLPADLLSSTLGPSACKIDEPHPFISQCINKDVCCHNDRAETHSFFIDSSSLSYLTSGSPLCISPLTAPCMSRTQR